MGKAYTFKIQEGWDGQGYMVLTQGLEFNTIQSNFYKNGLLMNGFAILFDNNFELDEETIEMINLLIRKSSENSKTSKQACEGIKENGTKTL